ncbi:MAG: hypothetical protein JJT87_19675 [Halomonas sp.]|nr:hypothetical protein [Halomonas sp.]MCC5904137.1 hypothetical protein [Halomonas sp.]
MSDTPLIFIDVETTGTRATRDCITEITNNLQDYRQCICEAQQLCPQVPSLEKGNGHYFAHQLGKHKGAYCGKEPLADHTKRTQEAMEKLQIGTLQIDTWQ